MLAGAHEVQIDSAGRLTVPSRFRTDLGDEVMVTTALSPNRFLWMFSGQAFEDTIRGLFPLPTIDFTQQSVKRTILGNAFPIRLDKAGRALLPAELRQHAGLVGPAKVVGMDNLVEIWAADAYADWYRVSESPEMKLRTLTAIEGLAAMRLPSPGAPS